MSNPNRFELELFDSPIPNCFRGGFVKEVTPLERWTGEYSNLAKFEGYICQIDESIERSILSQELVLSLPSRGERMFSSNPINKYFDPGAILEPRAAEDEIILDLIIPVDDNCCKRMSDVPFIIDKNATVPIRLGMEVLRSFALSYYERVINGEQRRFAIFEVKA